MAMPAAASAPSPMWDTIKALARRLASRWL